MLKFLVLHCLFGAVFCGFFDLSDIDDPMTMFWNPKRDKPDVPKGRECQALTNIGPRYGICQNPTTCLLFGGQVNGYCGVLGTCCTYSNGCGKITNKKISYFERTTGEYNHQDCNHEVVLANSNVCQIRLDFETFNLAPATQTSTSKCDSDRLMIFPNLYAIPELCGNNDRQHVYIHVNQTDGTRKVVLKMILLSNIYPQWKIKITQLECPGRFNSQDAANDYNMLAPLGAIQYYTHPKGEIRSFGFDPFRALNTYTNNENYAMVFKRREGVCGMKFTVKYWHLPSENSEEDSNETSSINLTDKLCSSDYLFVPNVKFVGKSYDVTAKVCSNKLSVGDTFESVVPGPFMVHFHSGLKFQRPTDERKIQAFHLAYELMTTCNT